MKQTPAATRPSKPAAAAPQPKAVELTAIQELAIDIFGDMLLNGARREETELLLNALLMHQWRRDFPDWPSDPDQAIEDAQTWASNRYEDAYRELVASWPKEPAPSKEPSLKTITDRVRFSVRNQVREALDDFLGDALPEELYLMRDILSTRESTHKTAGFDTVQEIYLARAIGEATGGSYWTTYLKAPAKMVQLIRQLVDARKTIEKAEESA